MTSAFLGVEQSFLGQPWHERLDGGGHARALTMTQVHGLPDLLARVLAGRGVTAETCGGFLEPSLRDLLLDPYTLVDMEPAVERLVRAIRSRETVAIFGDYDVDGAASAALLGSFLRAAGLDPHIHIPDRILEGYGPNVAAIRQLAGQGATLLVTVDCGTTSTGPLAEAKRLGLDAVVLDHHRSAAALPDAVAIVNPNRTDDLSGLGHLCAAGVVFMLLVALARRLKREGLWSENAAPDLLCDLDLVALATVADVVPLVGLNRAFVTKGLAVMRARGRPGLRALLDIAGADGPPTAFHLGFLLGPRVNAGGRIGDSGLGTRLMMSRDDDECRTVAETLDRLNRERRVIELEAVDAAEAEALAGVSHEDDHGRTIVCASPDWHPGVVGLVAARLRERFNRPSFALAINGGVATGSGRSMPGVDLGRAVHAAVVEGVLLKGGGHAMAAGLTVETDRIPAFRAFMDATLAPEVQTARAVTRLVIDACLSARALTPDLVMALDRAGPFGTGNPDPVVVFPTHRVKAVQAVGNDHIRLTVESPDGTTVKAMAFRAATTGLGLGLQGAVGRPLHLAGTLSLNRWGGGAGRAELRLLDAAFP